MTDSANIVSDRLTSLDALRGIAASSVCFFHFCCGNSGLLPASDWLKFIAGYGWLGVQSFFVISGFIIPYAMLRRQYRIRDGSKFLLSRALRIEPPYIVSVLLIVVLNYGSNLTPGFQGIPFELSLTQLLSHFFYLNAFTGTAWYNPVYWTLAIEFQYYIFIALCFPLISANRRAIRLFSTIAMALLGCTSDSTQYLIYWLPLFCIGIVAFQYQTKQIAERELLILTCLFAGIVAYKIGYLQAIIGIVTALLIVKPRLLSSSWIAQKAAMIGTISYSLYLIHVPVGGRVINLGMRYSDQVAVRYGLVLLAALVSLLTAYLFWRFVERPAQQLSNRYRANV